MEKVTQVNIDGRNYQFLAGQAVQGSCASQATDWTKIIDLPGETGIVDGTFLVIDFTYGNEVGFGVPRTAYSDDGENFYWDDQLTDPVALPPPSNYEATLVSGEEYSLIEFPVLSLNNQAFPVCDARGHIRGADLWNDNDSVILLFVDSKFFALAAGGSGADIKVYPTKQDIVDDLPNIGVGAIVGTSQGNDGAIDAVVEGDMRLVTSNAVARAMGSWVRVMSIDTNSWVDGLESKNGRDLAFHFAGCYAGSYTFGSSSTPVFTLPEGWRPTSSARIIVMMWCSEVNARIAVQLDITSNGKAVVQDLTRTGRTSFTTTGFWGDFYLHLM